MTETYCIRCEIFITLHSLTVQIQQRQYLLNLTNINTSENSNEGLLEWNLNICMGTILKTLLLLIPNVLNFELHIYNNHISTIISVIDCKSLLCCMCKFFYVVNSCGTPRRFARKFSENQKLWFFDIFFLFIIKQLML